MRPRRQRPNFGFKLLHRLLPHRHIPRIESKPQELKPLGESGDLGLLGTERQSESGEMPLGERVSLIGLRFGTTEHHKVVGIPYKAVSPLMEFPVELIEGDVCEQGRNHAANDIANNRDFLDRLIPRERLRPTYGSGSRSS